MFFALLYATDVAQLSTFAHTLAIHSFLSFLRFRGEFVRGILRVRSRHLKTRYAISQTVCSFSDAVYPFPSIFHETQRNPAGSCDKKEPILRACIEFTAGFCSILNEYWRDEDEDENGGDGQQR